MKPAAVKANKLREELDELPQGFAFTVVADYIGSLPAEKLKDMLETVKNIIAHPPKKRSDVLIPLEIA